MKKSSYPLLLLIFLITQLSAQTYSLAGTWQGTKDGEVGKFVLDKKGYATIIQGGETIGGKKYTAGGMSLKVKYDVDATKVPMTIDFIIMKHDDDSEITRMVGIYKFVNEKTLIFNLNTSGKVRPKIFDPNSPDQIVLSRIK